MTRIRSTEFFEPIWEELDGSLRPTLYIGLSAEIMERFCGVGVVLDGKILPYRETINQSSTAELYA